MEQTWRWFGPDDDVTLSEARQAGASGIVTALHHIPYGEIWTMDEIGRRKAEVSAEPEFGLRWSVVESLPVHERIKLGEGDLEPLFENYRQSMRNLAASGITTICYNFMPVLDWTRTTLAHPLPGGGTALRFDAAKFAAFDCLMLRRPGAEADHHPDAMRRGESWFAASTDEDRAELLASIMAGLPGAFDRYDIEGLRAILERYSGVTRDVLRGNLARFLRAVVLTAEEVGIRLAIHPDDPPRALMGLSRIVSEEDDLAFVIGAVDSVANGITLCSGSLGASPRNDVPAIARRFADRIHFAHLRNVAKEPDGSFTEADHLAGDTDMVALVDVVLTEEARRRDAADERWRIPFRPDHGHALLTDRNRNAFPGYTAVGRLKGLAELRGVMTAIAHGRGWPM